MTHLRFTPPAPARKAITRWAIGTYLLAVGLVGSASAADIAIPANRPDRWAIDYTSAMLWKVGGGATPLEYVLTPQIISVLCPPITQRPFAGGMLVLRTRLSLLLEPIVTGPETHFLGTAAAADLEWRSPSGKFAAFVASGGGVGFLDSRGQQIKGAQGQDFNLNWLVHSGLRFRTGHDWQWSLGVYFQHISNKGMNKINPGLNALGPTLGVMRRF